MAFYRQDAKIGKNLLQRSSRNIFTFHQVDISDIRICFEHCNPPSMKESEDERDLESITQ